MRGVPVRPLPSQESKCGHFLSFQSVFQTDLATARAPPRVPPRLRAPASPAPLCCSPSGSSTVRARRSERVRRLSCSIALSILGAPSVLPQPRRRPLSPEPYIPPRPVLRAEAPARPGHRPGLRGKLGAASSVRVSGAAGPTTEGNTRATAARALPAATAASLLDSHGLLGTVVLSLRMGAIGAEPRWVRPGLGVPATLKAGKDGACGKQCQAWAYPQVPGETSWVSPRPLLLSSKVVREPLPSAAINSLPCTADWGFAQVLLK